MPVVHFPTTITARGSEEPLGTGVCHLHLIDTPTGRRPRGGTVSQIAWTQERPELAVGGSYTLRLDDGSALTIKLTEQAVTGCGPEILRFLAE